MSVRVTQPMAWPAADMRPGVVRSDRRPPTSEPATMPKPASTSSSGRLAAEKPPTLVSQGDT